MSFSLGGSISNERTHAGRGVRRRGDRRDMILLTGTNCDVGGRRPSAHSSFPISNTVVRRRHPAMFCQTTSLALCDLRSLATTLITRVSFHAKGSVSRTTAATSSIAGVKPIASLNRPYRAGDNAPAPIVLV
jgi:hypothetical protein